MAQSPGQKLKYLATIFYAANFRMCRPQIGANYNMLRDFIHYRFPPALTSREHYFVTVARNRCLLVMVICFSLGLLV